MPQLDVLAGEPGRGAWQVVGGEGGQAARPPAVRGQDAAAGLPVPFEPEHGRTEHAARRQLLPDARLDRAEVLADHRRPGPVRLQGQHAEHRLRVVADVRALGGRVAFRHPPEAEQAHHVVDAQGPGVPRRCP